MNQSPDIQYFARIIYHIYWQIASQFSRRTRQSNNRFGCFNVWLRSVYVNIMNE